ncbi:hypothetical protein [Methanoregula sp.]|uniref:hypothetical protein n=1 Tax=Methanoregula sp. TaxID=2052170 RepID=UPI00260026BE|nr:hypothetical protein [Methanoregula sp.]
MSVFPDGFRKFKKIAETDDSAMQGAIGIIVAVDCLLRILFGDDGDEEPTEFVRMDRIPSAGWTGSAKITTVSTRFGSGGIVNA